MLPCKWARLPPKNIVYNAFKTVLELLKTEMAHVQFSSKAWFLTFPLLFKPHRVMINPNF